MKTLKNIREEVNIRKGISSNRKDILVNDQKFQSDFASYQATNLSIPKKISFHCKQISKKKLY